MAQTPEGRVKAQVKKILTGSQRWGSIYQFWPVQSGYGSTTLDCLGCYEGFAFAIETKSPCKKATARQKLAIRDMEAAGCAVFVIDGDTSLFEAWLTGIQRGDYLEHSDWEF
jgi:hypothetical protein